MQKLKLQIEHSPITSFLVLDWLGDANGLVSFVAFDWLGDAHVSVHTLTSSSLDLLISIKVACLEFTAFSACAFLLAARESLFTVKRE